METKKYFLYANNRYGYSRVIAKGLSFKDAVRRAKIDNRDAVHMWLKFSVPHNNVYEVYEEGKEPEVDKPDWSTAW
ncbi:MAG: hypothetical protein IRZ03_18725 [Acidobacterium ailaaui]|nr:hypothetical protein [Pseudacidobacterium ailaaui]